MAWRDTLYELRAQLAAARAERLAVLQEENAERQQVQRRLTELVSSLEIASLLQEMNTVMLEGKGKIETFVSWEHSGEEDDAPASDLDFLNPFDDEEEDADVISLILTWEEDGEREVDVDVGDSEDGVYLQVAGVEIRQEPQALQDALVEAFRAELEL
ncbi:MAG: hypothetical protein ACE5Q6_10995 [Dehalococcoidia bacterium]